MFNFAHIILHSIKKWFERHKPSFSWIRFIFVALITIALGEYYINCNSPSRYYNDITIGIHNRSIKSDSLTPLSFIYNRNIIWIDSKKKEGIDYKFYKDAIMPYQVAKEIDSLAKSSIESIEDSLSDGYFYAFTKSSFMSYLLTVGINTKDIDVDYIHLRNHILPHSKDSSYIEICHLYFSDKEIGKSLINGCQEIFFESIPSWLQYGDMSRFELSINPHLINVTNYPPKIELEFNDVVQVDTTLLYPAPDSIGLTGFAYTDSTKIVDICQNGIHGLCRYPKMEGWQLARTFLLTTLLSLLLTLFFTMLIDFIRLSKNLYKLGHFVLFSIVWLICCYILFIMILNPTNQDNKFFHIAFPIIAIVTSVVSFIVVYKVLEKYDISLYYYDRSKSVLKKVLYFVSTIVICIGVYIVFSESVVWSIGSYLNRNDLQIWKNVLGAFVLIAGFYAPIVWRFKYNYGKVFCRLSKKIKTFNFRKAFRNVCRTIRSFVVKHKVLTIVLIIFIVALFELYCCIYTDRCLEKCSNNKDCFDLYGDVRFKLSLVGHKELEDYIWDNNIEDYIADNNIGLAFDSIVSSSWAESNYASFWEGSDYYYKTYIEDSVFYIIRTNNKTGMRDEYNKKICNPLYVNINTQFTVSPDGKRLVGTIKKDYNEVLILFVDDEIKESKTNDCDAKYRFIDNNRVMAVSNNLVSIYDFRSRDWSKPIKTQYFENKVSFVQKSIINSKVDEHKFGHWIVDSKNNFIEIPRENIGFSDVTYDNRYVVVPSRDTLYVLDYKSGTLCKSSLRIPNVSNIEGLVFENNSHRLWFIASADSTLYIHNLYYLDLDNTIKTPVLVSHFNDLSCYIYTLIWSPTFGICYYCRSKCIIWPNRNFRKPYIYGEDVSRQVFSSMYNFSVDKKLKRVIGVQEVSWEEVYEYAYKKYMMEEKEDN